MDSVAGWGVSGREGFFDFYLKSEQTFSGRESVPFIFCPLDTLKSPSGFILFSRYTITQVATEPALKRAIAFFDGQNLFYAAKSAFGYGWPNFDPLKLAQAVCTEHGWQLEKTCFYTGLPSPKDDAFWNHFWNAKLTHMARLGVQTFSRHLKYRNQTVSLPGGGVTTVLVGSEKGVDVRLALDVVSATLQNTCDVAVIFSQDQDLSEVADEVRTIARQQDRWIKLVSAYPVSPTYRNTRGIEKTDWLHISRTTYDSCLDSRNYRPKQQKQSP